MTRIRFAPFLTPCLVALLSVGGLVGTAGTLAAADAPTTEQWAPVQAAIVAGSPEAGDLTADITTRFPNWVDGWTARARLTLANGDQEKAWEYARQALTIERSNADAVAIAMQALMALGRNDAALKVGGPLVGKPQLDRLGDGRQGWIGYYATLASLASNDVLAATANLRAAKTCAGTTIPAEFHLTDARIAVMKKDQAQAEALLQRATTTDPKLWDAWYELGRVRSALASEEHSNAGKRSRLDGAITAFHTVTKALPSDHESWWGAGRANLELARIDLIEGADAGAHLREASIDARRATDLKPDFTPAWTTLGESELRLERWAEAAKALQQARTLGSDDATVLSNLAIALQKSGDVEGALAIGGDTSGTQSAADLLTRGLSAFQAGHYALATQSLRAAADHPDLAEASETRAQTLRFLGHAFAKWAETGESADRDAHLDDAADAYRQAGNLVDHLARRHFAVMQSQRSPELAYAAGWTLLGWKSWMSGQGWALVIGNYGASRAWANPLHYIIWGLLVFLPLVLWLKSLFRTGVPAENVRPPRPNTPPPAPTKVASERQQRGQGSSTVRPQVARPPESGALTSRKDRERASTEPATKPRATAPRPAGATRRRQPLPETEEITKPKE